MLMCPFTCTPINHQTSLCWTRGATEVEDEAKAVLILSRVEHGAVEFCLVLSLSQPVESQRRRSRFLWSQPRRRRRNSNSPFNSCIAVQHDLPADVSTRWGYHFNRHGPHTASLVCVGVLHQELIGEYTGQVERFEAFHFLRCVR